MAVAEISFPFRTDASGGIAVVKDANLLARDHVRTVIATYPGERVMRPDFGLPARDVIFENLGSAGIAELNVRTRTALIKNVPDVTFQQVDAKAMPDDPYAVQMTVTYNVSSSDPNSISQSVDAVVAGPQ